MRRALWWLVVCPTVLLAALFGLAGTALQLVAGVLAQVGLALVKRGGLHAPRVP